MALGLALLVHAVALRPSGARSSSSRHQPVCLGDSGADLLPRCHWAVTGRHQRRRAAREARRLCGSGAGMSCSSSREIRLVGHRKPGPSGVVRRKEMENSWSNESERVSALVVSVCRISSRTISCQTWTNRFVRKTRGPPRFYSPMRTGHSGP